jgi:putative two-component system response regulator
VLLKKSRLTRSEHALMKQHPVIGDDLCRTLRSLELVSPIIRHHHERRDGRGYPDGLAGDQIPFLAQIVRVVDIFDALTTHRPYRRAVSRVKALQILQEEARTGGCSEDLVDRFVELHNSGGLVGPHLEQLDGSGTDSPST